MLSETLRQVRSVKDLPRLFGELGYVADCHPFLGDAEVVARWRGFKVVAAPGGDDPQERVRRLARSLAATSGRALAVTVGAGRELCLAAPRLGAPGVSRVFVLSLTTPTADALEHLHRFRPKAQATGLAHALHVCDLLASEIAGERFFEALRDILERMAASLRHRGTAAERRMLTLLHLTRVLFLYFVQVKGWLDGRTDYLQTLLDDALAARQSFHEDRLAPLFFEALNRPRAARRGTGLGSLPYLNGGLFEPQPIERRLGPATFSNRLWRDAFDGLFERFRFCVREADEVNAIAPDMLGKVFERVMDPGSRHDSGTFYTPEPLVRRIVEAAIETALTGRDGLPPDDLRALVAREGVAPHRRAAVRRRLQRLRVLDPAVGSGAFLLGALDTLTDLHLSLRSHRTPIHRLHLRRWVLRTNLLGVDVNPVAVRLAELRLWLAVVADDPTREPARVEPLPNLDGVLRQGDALLDPLGAVRRFAGAHACVAPAQGRAVRDARLGLFAATGAERRAALRRLRAAERELAERLLREARQRADASLRELASAARGRDLFGQRARLLARQREAYRALRADRDALKRAHAAVRDGAVPFFSFEVHAADVLGAGGFGVVVGNPPWVRAERLARGAKRALQARFSWWRPERSAGYAHLPDLAIAFLQRALELAAPGAGVGFLMPSKIATAGYGEPARRQLVAETTIRYLHRVPDKEAATFGATTYPLAVVLKNDPPDPTHTVALRFDADGAVAQQALATHGPWILVADRQRHAVETLREAGRPLADVAPPALGLKTGADGILVGTIVRTDRGRSVVRFATATLTVDAALIRPVLRGRDVTPFRVRPVRAVLWAYDAHGRVLPRVPSDIRGYLDHHRRELARRADLTDGPPWSLFRLRAALGDNRVVWADIAKVPTACALDETPSASALPLNSCYVSCAPDRETALVIAAVLNSTWTMALATLTADEARGGYRRHNARVISAVPVPAQSDEAAALARLSAAAHRGEPPHHDDLDEAVADALRLPATARDVLRRLACPRR